MPPPLSPPPRHTRALNLAIIKSGHMRTHTPRQPPRSPTTLPSPQKRSDSSSHAWPRLPPPQMCRANMLHQYQYQPKRLCVRRNPRPSHRSDHPVATLRWGIYHTQRTWSASRPRVGVGTRPCSGQGHNLPLPHQHERELQHRHLLAPSCRPSRLSRTPRLNLGGTVMAATVAEQAAPVGPSLMNSVMTTTGAILLRGADGVGRSNRRKIRSLRASSVEAARSPATPETKLVGIERARESFLSHRFLSRW